MRAAVTAGVSLSLVGTVVGLVGIAPAIVRAQTGPQQCPDTELTNPSLLDVPLPHTTWPGTWDFTRGDGVTVAVIDTGVAPHPRLGDVIDGGDLVDGTGAFHDCDAHGTFVAGVIAARPGDDAVSGVAPGASILSIRQTAGEVGNLSSLATAVDTAVTAGAEVINISTVSCSPPGSRPSGSDDVEAAVARAEQEGSVVVSAAGNISEDCPVGFVSWPSVIPEVLAVTAIQPAEEPSGYTDPTAETWALTGEWVDVAANGGPVVGLDPRSDRIVDSVYRGSTPAPVVGTSFAAPIVAGTAALMLSRDPGLTSAEIRSTIISTASPVPDSAGIGVGVVDPVAAVTWPRTSPAGGGGHSGVGADLNPGPVAAPTVPVPRDPAPGRRLLIAATGVIAVALVGSAAALVASAIGANRRS